MEQLKFKKLDYSVKKEDGTEEIKKSEGKLPTRATAGDAGLDLYATRITQEVDNSGKLVLVYHTDLAVEIPEGYCGLLMMKSSISKRSIALTNGVGLIDTGYRGELMAKFKVTTDAIPTVYTIDEPFAQLVIVPCSILEPTLVEELSETERGEKDLEKLQQNKIMKINNKNMKELNITITPVSASGVGNFIDVNINGLPYRTETVQGEFTEEVMKQSIEKLMPTIPAEQREEVELKFYQLLDAIANTKAEEEYRAQHSEEFMPENFEPSVEEVTDEAI